MYPCSGWKPLCRNRRAVSRRPARERESLEEGEVPEPPAAAPFGAGERREQAPGCLKQKAPCSDLVRCCHLSLDSVPTCPTQQSLPPLPPPLRLGNSGLSCHTGARKATPGPRPVLPRPTQTKTPTSSAPISMLVRLYLGLQVSPS